MIVTDYHAALSLLQQHPDNMIVEDMNFSCWVRRGICQNGLEMLANGHTVSAISKEVFDRLSIKMEQDWCSQFRQIHK